MRVKAAQSHECGLTLVETLVAVAIMGLAFASILGALATSITGSDLHRKQAIAQTVLRNKAELVKKTPYQICGTAGSYEAQVAYTPPAPDAGFGSTVTAVDHYATIVSGGAARPSPVPSPATCPVADEGFQRLTIRVTSPQGEVDKTMKVFKRR